MVGGKIRNSKISAMEASKNNNINGAEYRNIKLYTRRWFLLALFMLYTSNVALPWLQFASIGNIVSRYYGVSGNLVEWTAIMVMAARAIFLFPSLFLMDKLGTKKTLILASLLCVCGSCIKCFSVFPDGFHIAMTGQIFSALSLVFSYSLMGRFSSAWFSSDEISTAGALGCTGEIVGCAISFLLPTRFVPDSSHVEEVEKGMLFMHYFYTAWASITLILITVFFKSKPSHPPSAAQVHSRLNEGQCVLGCIKKLLGMPYFLMFLVAQSIFYGSGGNALWTLLNLMINTNFPGYTVHTGTIGCANQSFGIIGSVVMSYIQDRTRKYKCMTVTLSIMNCIIVALFAISLKMDSITYVYITFSMNGFLILAYYATTIQMGIELSFPVPEGITVAVMSMCVELASMIFAAIYGITMRKYGDWKTNICVTVVMLVSTIIICLVPPKFKREEIEKAAKLAKIEESLNGVQRQYTP